MSEQVADATTAQADNGRDLQDPDEVDATEPAQAAGEELEASDGAHEGQQLSPADAAALIRKLKGENKSLRKTRTEALNKLQKHEDAQKTEAQRLAERLATLEAENSKLQADRRRANLQQVVQRHGVRSNYADLVAEKLEALGLDYDEQGEPVDVEGKLSDLRSRYAALFEPTNGRGSIDAKAGRGSSPTSGNWLINEFMRGE